jgi:hypothetical protein
LAPAIPVTSGSDSHMGLSLANLASKPSVGGLGLISNCDAPAIKTFENLAGRSASQVKLAAIQSQAAPNLAKTLGSIAWNVVTSEFSRITARIARGVTSSALAAVTAAEVTGNADGNANSNLGTPSHPEKWTPLDVALILQVQDPAVAAFWHLHHGFILRSGSSYYFWQAGPTPEHDVEEQRADPLAKKLGQIWVKVPDSMTSKDVAQFIIDQCVNTGGDFSLWFEAYLTSDPTQSLREDRFLRGQELREKHGLETLARTGKVAEMYVRFIASLTPGGLAVLAAYDASEKNYLSAVVEFALLVPYGALLEKGFGFITIEGPSASGEIVSLQLSTDAIRAFRRLPLNKQTEVLQAISKTKNIEEAAEIINTQLGEFTGDTGEVVTQLKNLNHLKGELGEWSPGEGNK